LATPTSGRRKSSSVKPIALNMARAPARSNTSMAGSGHACYPAVLAGPRSARVGRADADLQHRAHSSRSQPPNHRPGAAGSGDPPPAARLPCSFAALAVVVGRVVFIRHVRRSGCVTLLGVRYRVGKRWAGHYIVATLYTRTMTVKFRHPRACALSILFQTGSCWNRGPNGDDDRRIHSSPTSRIALAQDAADSNGENNSRSASYDPRSAVRMDSWSAI
jgi:hypothetical protein